LSKDQARGHGIEHLAQRERAGAGDVDQDLLVVRRLAVRQGLQRRALLVYAPGVAGVAARDDLVDEAAPSRQVIEVARSA